VVLVRVQNARAGRSRFQHDRPLISVVESPYAMRALALSAHSTDKLRQKKAPLPGIEFYSARYHFLVSYLASVDYDTVPAIVNKVTYPIVRTLMSREEERVLTSKKETNGGWNIPLSWLAD